LKEGPACLDPAAIEKMLCPHLGIACTGKPDDLKLVKGKPIPGSANWTHFFADARNSNCGTDTAVRAPLELLWFRDTDYEMANRHSMSSPTMVYNGYMVMPGTYGVRVANMYNGRPLWQYDVPGLNLYPGGFSYARRLLTGNMCVADGAVYVRHLNYCLRFDIRTGKLLGQWKLPAAGGSAGKGLWGYVACKDGVLYGSIANPDLAVRGYPGPGTDTEARARKFLDANPELNPNHHHPDSKILFAMDAKTGKVKWVHKAKNSIRSAAIAVGNGIVYFVDKPTSPYDDYSYHLGRRGSLQEEKIKRLAEKNAAEKGTSAEAEMQKLKNPHGPLIALDSQTGTIAWKTDEKTGGGNILTVSTDHNALVMIGDQTVVFEATTGEVMWKGPSMGRPMMHGKELRAGSRIYDIGTGQRIGQYPNLGGYCAPTLGSPMLLACRSGVIGYRDMTDGTRDVQYFGGIRPGCYMDMTPAGGLLVMSDGASGCRCSYLNQCTIALQPAVGKKRPPSGNGK